MQKSAIWCNQWIEENSTSEGSTKMNPTAKATTTARTGNGSKSSSSMSNEGKQNEGEKDVVLCVSIKICHLTHFTGLAYKKHE
jgi:hypothetical protein